ncbi:MAG: hypothetical protein ABI178_04430 [Rhodanobacter sp.]
MRVVLTIRESNHGLWCICSGPDILFDRLHFAQAIRVGRALAREEHDISGSAAWVEMVCHEFNIPLLHYPGNGGSLAAEPA